MFRKSIAALVAAAVLATGSLSATTQAHAGKKDAVVAGLVIGAVIGAVASKKGYAVEYKTGHYRKHERRHERKGWNKKRRSHCELIPVYEYTKYGKSYLVGYDKVCN